ncbi:acyl-[acyl-carrier-protein] thioesterase [Virgibacillus soli]
MTSASIYKKDYHVDWGDVDFKKELKLSTLFSFFQDASSMASEELGFGIEHLQQDFGVAWVLMKIRVDIVRNPKVGETITIETWPLEPGKIACDRDFIVRDGDSNILIRAISSWVIMDMHERKIKRTSTVPIVYPFGENERAIEGKLGKLKVEEPLEVAYQKMIGYSDIDFNGHLNNSKYVDYMMDCFQVEEHQKYKVKSIEVHFTNEAFPGEVMALQKVMVGQEEVYIEGKNDQSEKVIFKSKLIIEEV